MRTLIQFKNAHGLRLDSGGPDLLEGPLPPRLGLGTVQQWKLEGFRHIFVLSDPRLNGETAENIQKLTRLCRAPDLVVEELSATPLREGDHASIQNYCRRLQLALREGACRLIYGPETETEAVILAAAFLLTLKSMRTLSPEQVGEFVLRHAPQGALLRSIQEFKQYLDPGYRLPPETPAPPAPELPEEPRSTASDAFDDLRSRMPAATEPAFASAPGPLPTPSAAPPREKESPLKSETTVEPESAAPAAAMAEAEAEASPAPAPAPVAILETAKESPSLADVETEAKEPAEAIAKSSTDAPAAEPAAATATATATATAVTPARVWKAGRFTIGVKLLSIITGLIIAALSTSIIIASYSFSEEMGRRIEENNRTVASVTGQRVESEMRNIAYKAHLMALTLDQNIGTNQQQALVTDLFFRNNPDFAFLAIARQADDGLRFVRELPNPAYQATSGITAEQFREVIVSSAAAFARSFGGGVAVVNASQGSTPLLGIGVPLGESAAILIVDPAQTLKAFQIEGNTLLTTYMVSDNGEVIAHPDSNQVLAHANKIKSPIVQRMFSPETKYNNGILRFVDTDQQSYLGAFYRLSLGGLGIVSSANESQAFAGVAQIQRQNLLILLITLAISFLVVYFFSKTLTVPIVDLVGATRKIEAGDYNVDIEAITGDEIGSLTFSFRNMAVGLQEREKVKDALSRFANKKVAELALRGELKLGGETKDAAIFFSDLRGFTAMSEGMTPEDVVAYLNEYFTGMVGCVNATGGEVDKFIGDAVMAHWGAIDSTGNDTENAINAALLMRKALIEFNQRGEGKRPFAKMGCGINTGPVVAGQLGSSEKMSYTVIGDAVNLASRIESLNKPFGTDILISQESYERVPNTYKVEEMPAIKVKGKSEPQVIYAVIGRLDDPACPPNLDAVRSMLGIEFDSAKAVDPDAKEEKFEVLGAAK